MKHELMKLPYDYNALEPLMSKETLEFHHDKHHQTYVTKLNDAIVGTEFETMTLKEIIRSSDGGIFNNAAQIYNHDFFFNSLSHKPTKPSQTLVDSLINHFGSLEDFQREFTLKAATHFGSGWVWLVLTKAKKLEIIATSNAQTPITQDLIPLLTIDVWEHAYYIDYRNARPKYIEAFWKLVNWEFVSSHL